MIQLFNEQLKHLSGALYNNSGNDPQIKYLLAVSGGIDSMCMAHLFLKSGLKFSIAHVNFSLRDQESDGDEQLVRSWADANQIECFVKRLETAEYARNESLSIQMAARELRYGWFDELMKSGSYNYLAIAHNLNDTAETLFINLLRGTGLSGLTGIKEKSGYIIRPLLKFTREEISAFVLKEGVPFREDSSNKKSYYSRNRIRNNVFPEFEKINPSFLKTIEKNTRNFSEAALIIDDLKNETLKKITEPCVNQELKINIKKLLKTGHPSFWLFQILNEYGFNDTQYKDIIDTLTGISGKYFESAGYTLIKDRTHLLLCKNTLLPKTGSDELNFEAEVFESDLEKIVEFGNLKISMTKYSVSKGFAPDANPNRHYLDFDMITFPLAIRRWRDGDRFKPLGMDNFKKVSDFFIDQKIDLVSKKSSAVITTNGQILCLPGLRIDNRFKITGTTKNVFEITIC